MDGQYWRKARRARLSTPIGTSFTATIFRHPFWHLWNGTRKRCRPTLRFRKLSFGNSTVYAHDNVLYQIYGGDIDGHRNWRGDFALPPLDTAREDRRACVRGGCPAVAVA